MRMKALSDGKVLICCLLIILAVATRLIPHPMNFTPVGAVGLFAGAYLAHRSIWLVPLLALLISDFFIGFYDPVTMLFVYAGFAASAVIGRAVLFNKRSVIRLGGSAFASASVFFILSNFGLWLTGLYYPLTSAGLVECYVLAIPFFGNTLLGDLFYAGVLFGTFEAIREWSNRHQEMHTA